MKKNYIQSNVFCTFIMRATESTSGLFFKKLHFFSDCRSYTCLLKGNKERLINENINEKPPQSFCSNNC